MVYTQVLLVALAAAVVVAQIAVEVKVAQVAQAVFLFTIKIGKNNA
jgi:hypothetical protein